MAVIRTWIALGTLVALCLGPQDASAQPVDPGVRGGAAGAGPPIANLAPLLTKFWKAGQGLFKSTFSATGSDTGTLAGLGPAFNGNSCATCHSQPGVGGSSLLLNQQIGLATLDGAQNTVPSFISTQSPSREARFLLNADGTPDNSVHQLFVVTGQAAVANCKYQQPDFAAAIANNNLALRIPTPLFGLGLVENTTDLTLMTDATHIAGANSLGIVSGVFNSSGNNGAIMKYGWKAQNPSILMFASEALNVEMGVTNELFPTERNSDLKKHCELNPSPEDPQPVLAADDADTPSPNSDFSTIAVNLAAFMRLNAPPVPLPINNDIQLGQNAFANAGCGICHIPTHTTTTSSIDPTLSNVTYSPFSDFALHQMGSGLADGISQGVAGAGQFRTAPLWGLGQRIYFLHDGRTNNLVAAIAAHASPGSEANQVIANFNNLSAADQQSLIDFLRSL